jgi:hypothetical protein
VRRLWATTLLSLSSTVLVACGDTPTTPPTLRASAVQTTATTSAAPASTSRRCVERRGADESNNRGITVKFCASNLAPRVGEVVVFSVMATDPDARIDPLDKCAPNSIEFGDEVNHCAEIPGCGIGPGGPRPSPREPGMLDEHHRHAYMAPGSYRAVVSLRSGHICQQDFVSTIDASVVVQVQAPRSQRKIPHFTG